MASGDQHSRKGGASGCSRGCLGVLVVMLLIVVILGLAAALYDERIEEQTAARLQEIRDAGEPAAMGEIDAWIGDVADEDNAAILLLKAFETHGEPASPDSPIPFVNQVDEPELTEPLPEDMKAAMAGYLIQEEVSLAAVSEAVKRSDCRFPINYSMGAAVDLPHLARLRSLQRVMGIKALYEAEMGNSAGALKTINDGLRLSEATRREPILVSQLVRISMHGIVVNTIEHSLNRTTFTSEQLKELQDEIKKVNTGDCIYTGLLGERCMMLDTYAGLNLQSMAVQGGASPFAGSAWMSWGPLAWRNRIDQRHALATVDAVIDVAKLPPAEAMKRIEEISEDFFPENRGKIQRLFTVLSDILTPALARSVDAQARDTSILNSAMTGVALVRYHQDKGSFPETLGILVPQYLDEIPLDCMDGQPLRYLHDDGGFTVYTIGPNKKDDGGTPPEEDKNLMESGDMTFTFRLRPNPGT